MDVEEDHILGDRTVILVEVKDMVKLFVKDKILGFDGWTVEFFSHFLDWASSLKYQRLWKSLAPIGFLVNS